MKELVILLCILVISIGLMPSVFAQSTNSTGTNSTSTISTTLSIDSLNVYETGGYLYNGQVLDNEIWLSINGQKPTNTELTLDYIYPNGQYSGTTTTFNNSTSSSYSVDKKIWNLNAGENYTVKVCTEMQQCVEGSFDIIPSFPSVSLHDVKVENGWVGSENDCGFLYQGQIIRGIDPRTFGSYDGSSVVWTCPTELVGNLDEMTGFQFNTFVKNIVNIVQSFTVELEIIDENNLTVFEDSVSDQTTRYDNSGKDYEIRWTPNNEGVYTANISVKSLDGQLLANPETLHITLTSSSTSEPTPSTNSTPIISQTIQFTMIIEANIGSTTIVVSGTTPDTINTLTVVAPNGNIVSIDSNIQPDSDGSFTSTIGVGGPMWKQDGVYQIIAKIDASTKLTETVFITNRVVSSPSATTPTQEETDNVSPQVLVPNDIVLQATNQSGAIASFNPQAIDNIDELLTPSCNYSSGSVFPIGTTIVTCTATDSSGNSNSNSFSVIVNYTDYSVPNWVKNVAGFWNQGDINDESFLEGISYLIQNDIIVVPSTETTTQTESTVPSWVKTNAGWWSSGEINDETFVNGIQYLIQIGLIQV